MRVTILGSSGQIGAYLTEYLRDKGHEVTEFDKNYSIDHDMTKIPNYQLRHAIKDSDFVFFLAFVCFLGSMKKWPQMAPNGARLIFPY